MRKWEARRGAQCTLSVGLERMLCVRIRVREGTGSEDRLLVCTKEKEKQGKKRDRNYRKKQLCLVPNSENSGLAWLPMVVQFPTLFPRTVSISLEFHYF